MQQHKCVRQRPTPQPPASAGRRRRGVTPTSLKPTTAPSPPSRSAAARAARFPGHQQPVVAALPLPVWGQREREVPGITSLAAHAPPRVQRRPGRRRGTQAHASQVCPTPRGPRYRCNWPIRHATSPAPAAAGRLLRHNRHARCASGQDGRGKDRSTSGCEQ